MPESSLAEDLVIARGGREPNLGERLIIVLGISLPLPVLVHG